MSRPKRARNVTSRIDIRVTDEEKTTFVEQANRAALTLSEYIRRCSLSKRIHSRVSDKAVARLSSLCGLQKHLLMQIKGHPHEAALRSDLNAILAGITTTLRTIVRHEETSE